MSRCTLQIRREPDTGKTLGRLAVAIDNRTVFDIEAGELKTALCEPGEVRITVTGPDGRGFARRIRLPEGQVVLLSLHEVSSAWWQSLLGSSRTLDLTEISRTPLAPPDPEPAEMLSQQMWIGHATSEQSLRDLMAEREEYYSDENAEREGTAQHIALSQFADAMGETSYDHDFLEYGFAKPGDDLETRFAGHSWVKEWAPVLRATLSAEELAGANVFVMFGVDRDVRFGEDRQISQPRDVELPQVRLRYVGEIDHPRHS